MEHSKNAPHTDPIQQLLTQATALMYKDSTRGLALTKQAFEQFQTLTTPKDPALEAEIHLNMGKHFGELSNFPESYTHLHQALTLFAQLENIDRQIHCLHVLTAMYIRYGEAEDSLALTLQILELLERAPNPSMEAQVLSGLGAIYHKIGDYDQERITYERAEAIHTELDEPMHLATLKNNQAMVYMALEKYDKAYNYVRESLDMMPDQKAPYFYIVVLCTAGEICTKRQDFTAAERYFRQSEELSQQHQYEPGQTYVYHGLCELYMAQQHYGRANQLAQQTLQQAQKAGMLSIEMSAHQLLSQSYKQLGEYEKALTHFEAYHELHKTTFSNQMQNHIINLRVIRETEKAQKSAEIFELQNVILEQEIHKQAAVEQSLRETNEELQAFAHMVAHDLRNPLGSLLLTIELMHVMFETWPPEKLHGRLLRAHSMVKQMTSVVDNLLLLAIPDKKEVIFEKLNMTAIITDVLRQIESLTAKHEGEIILPVDWQAGWGYEPWVAQIWGNLISNGIKYGGRPYQITLGSERTPDGHTRYWVDDNGQGIPPENQEEIFKPFTRLNPAQASGTGLGLAIVHKIIERMNGRLGFQPNAIGGCRFFFELPNSMSQVAQPQQDSQ